MSELESSGISQTGRVRQDNQDAICLADHTLSSERGWLYAVADGMGGYAHGGVASTLALEKLTEALYDNSESPVHKSLKRGVDMANLAVYQKSQQLNAGRMGTTLTAACLVGSDLHLAHIGDSRAYLIRDRRAVCLTNDHTTVGELVRMKVLSPDKVRTHEQRSILTRALGLQLFIQPDISRYSLRAGDRIVLCTDGVWSVLQDHEFAELAIATKHARELGEKLVELALERESDDNVSAVTVHVHSLSALPAEGKHHKTGIFSFRNLFSKGQDTALCSEIEMR